MSTKAVDVLNDLIKTCNDGKKGFAKAAEKVKREDLRHVLLAGATRCADSAAELAALVRSLGGEPATGGSAAGALHRGWVELKADVVGDTELAVLEEVERGEDSAKESYQQALKDDALVGNLRLVIERQFSGVLDNHRRVRELRDDLRRVAA